MKKKIIGATVGSPLPKPNLKQTDDKKGDFVHGRDIIPTKVSQLENDAKYLTEHQDISGKLDANKLPEAINTALAQAKESGEFDGKDGYTPVKGVDYFDGKDGDPGYTPVKGVDYFDGNPGYTPVKGKDYFDGEDGKPFTYEDFTPEQLEALRGEPGYTPRKGVDYFDGRDGYTPVKGKDYFDGDPGYTPVKGVDYTDGKDGASVTVSSVSESTADGGTNVVTFSDGKKLNVKNGKDGQDGAGGQRGTGILKVTTSPASYTTAIGSYTPKYRIALSTLKTQAKVDEVLIGDVIQYSYYQYQIDYLDSSYAYSSTTRVSLRGADGSDATVTVENIGSALGYTPADQETVSELSAEITNLLPKNQGSENAGKILVVGSDGNLTLTDMPEPGLSGDVVGTLDESNNILLSGDIAEGTYPLKWLMTDGTYADAGTLTVTLTPKPEAIINWIANSINADGTPYVGTNGEKGYKTDVRLSISSGAESTSNASGIKTTGFIPAKVGDTMRLKGVTINASASNQAIVFYNSEFQYSKTGGGSQGGSLLGVILGDVAGEEVSLVLNGDNLHNSNFNADVAYIRICAAEINENSIITINQPIE